LISPFSHIVPDGQQNSSFDRPVTAFYISSNKDIN
jgi:hypothetical protein